MNNRAQWNLVRNHDHTICLHVPVYDILLFLIWDIKKIRTIIYILNQDRWSWAPAQAKTIIWYFVCSVRSPACVCGGCGGGGRRGWGRPPRGLAVRRATPRGQMGPGPGGANAGVAARALRHRRAGGGAGQPALLQDHTLHCGSCAR